MLIEPLMLLVLSLAQTQAEPKHKLDLWIEQKRSNSVSVMDPTHVFARGELVRFRLKSEVNGFLYVIDQGSSGNFKQLFPSDELIQNRRLTAGKEYSVPPDESGWFKIEDPPGYDTVYVLISPVDLGKRLPRNKPGAAVPSEDLGKANEDTSAPSSATPRCDDELFRARGECLDSAAGVRVLDSTESLPKMFPRIPATSTRDLVIVNDSKDISISSSEPFEGPSIYQLRIAHR